MSVVAFHRWNAMSLAAVYYPARPRTLHQHDVVEMVWMAGMVAMVGRNVPLFRFAFEQRPDSSAQDSRWRWFGHFNSQQLLSQHHEPTAGWLVRELKVEFHVNKHAGWSVVPPSDR